MLHNYSCLFLPLMLNLVISPSAAASPGFIFNRFLNGNLILDGSAEIKPYGILQLTSAKKQLQVAHAFFPNPFPFVNMSSGKTYSFSTSFVFAIVPHYRGISSEGLAFVISPTFNLSNALPSQFLGLFNLTNDGEATNHIVAVELDTVQNKEINDIDDNHVGIDVDGLDSIAAVPASFLSGSFKFQNLSLISGQPLRVWAEYDSKSMRFNVTIAPVDVPKPVLPLLSSIVNLSSIFVSNMYVGFSSSTGPAAGSHYILGWSFCVNGRESELVISDLPSLPQVQVAQKGIRGSSIWLIVGAGLFLLMSLSGFLLVLKTRKLDEEVEEWETECGIQRLSYTDLHKATGGFSDENLLGSGGFGGVYKGLLPKSKQEVAVKRIYHETRHRVKEYIAEISILGQIRHRNLVQLLGYCRRPGKLILVYDFMPKGSLDRYLFDGEVEQSLTWKQRFNVVKGVAAGLFYLHEELEQVVLHRDIKASNVLLDADYNGKLGDFGLARLHDHGSTAKTTMVVGTHGYLAPELSLTGKSSTSSDVFSFGAFLLEVVCGKRPIEVTSTGGDMALVDWVLDLMERGEILKARDTRLREFDSNEVELVLKLGLMCLFPAVTSRPSMRQVVQYLEGEVCLPAMSAAHFCSLHSCDIQNVFVGNRCFSRYASGGGPSMPQGRSILEQYDSLLVHGEDEDLVV